MFIQSLTHEHFKVESENSFNDFFFWNEMTKIVLCNMLNEVVNPYCKFIIWIDMGVDISFNFSNGHKEQHLQSGEHVVYRCWNIPNYCHVGSLFCELWV